MIEYTVKVRPNGTKYWYLNGNRHRTGGPAIEWANGGKRWYLNGKLHRTEGPAIECADGHKEWFLNGKKLTEEEHRKAVSKGACDGKVVEIDGVKYTLKEVK